jgi:PST family polysaccharide transporter/lipopolysaccharide exporter
MLSSTRTLAADLIDSSQLTFAKVARTALWGVAASAVATAARALRVVVAAPFVSAHDFGLLAVTSAIVEGVNACSDLGTKAALVRQPGRITDALDAAFTLQVIRGLTLCSLLFVGAPLAAVWLDDRALVSVLRLMAVVPLLTGFNNPGMVLLTRRLEFGRLFTWSLVEPVLTLVVGVGLAMRLRSVWALVLTTLCAESARLVISYLAVSVRPGFGFHRRPLTELLAFGRWVFGTRILMFLSLRGDDLFIASALGTVAAGTYSIAFRYAELPVLVVTQAIVGVALPVWSGATKEPERVRRWFLQTCMLSGVLTAAVCAAAFTLAPLILPLPRGMTWESTRPLVLILMMASFGRSLILLAEPYFYAAGRPAVWFWMNVCRVGTTVALIVPLTSRFGTVGVAAAVTAGLFCTIPLAVWSMRAPSDRG